VVDDRLHAGVELLAGRQRHLAVGSPHRAIGQILERLVDDAQALAHLLQPDEIARVGVALGHHRHFEIVVLVAAVGPRLAVVERDAAGAQHRAGDTQAVALLRRDLADPACPPQPDRILRDHALILVDAGGEGFQHVLDPLDEARRHVLPEAARPDVRDGEPRAADELEDVHELLAFAEGVHQERVADAGCVHDVRAQPDKVRGETLQLGADDPEHLGARRNLHPHQFLDCQGIAQVVGHGRDVVHAIGVGQKVLVADRLALLLEAGVQIPDVGVGRDDRFAVELDHDAQHAVRGGVLRAHVQDHVLVGVGLLGRHLLHRLGLDDLLAEALELLVFPGHREGHRLAAARDILPQRVVGPVVGHQDAAQVGMAVELDAHQVVDLAFRPVGAGPQRSEAGHGRAVAARRKDLEADPFAGARRGEMINRAEAFSACVTAITAPVDH